MLFKANLLRFLFYQESQKTKRKHHYYKHLATVTTTNSTIFILDGSYRTTRKIETWDAINWLIAQTAAANFPAFFILHSLLLPFLL